MTVTVGDLTRMKEDYVVIECLTAPESLLGTTKATAKDYQSFNGMARMILNLTVKVKIINPQDNPEYYL